MGAFKFSLILLGLRILLWLQATRYSAFRKRLKEKNFSAQMRTNDGSVGRWFVFKDGKIKSKSGILESPDITLTFKTSDIAARLLMPPINQLDQINAMKDFLIGLDGPDHLTLWFTQTIMQTQTIGWEYGVEVGKGVT